METILTTIAQYARERVHRAQRFHATSELREQCESLGPADGKRFEDALRVPGLRFICEIKRASPSKGMISQDFPYLQIAQEYQQGGADCISCLTEPRWFMGSDHIFRQIRQEIATPMIRKDFVVDAYQLYEARLMGADAVLLICSILDQQDLETYMGIARQLGLSALVETHNADEVRRAVDAGATLIGVNNRDLRDFSVDFSNAQRLRDLVPSSAVFVAESGVSSLQDVSNIAAIGADAALVGEMLMRAPDKTAMIRAMREAS